MSKQDIESSQLKELFLSARLLIDVRAPIEFALGHLPGAINLPLLNDAEHAAVGTSYKKNGREAALSLGHELISGAVKEKRIQAWLEYIELNPEAIFYCLRGGLRSQISRDWVCEKGIERPLIVGGYKTARNFLSSQIEEISEKVQFLVVTGPTGSGKTQFLKDVEGFCSVVDLEKIANHRGSAFGGFDSPQPTQINFENQLALELLKIDSAAAAKKATILVEDESRMIGRCALPVKFFDSFRASNVLWIEESLEARVENIFQDYVFKTPIGHVVNLLSKGLGVSEIEKNIQHEKAMTLFAHYKRSLQAISKKLGSLRTTEILLLLEAAEMNFVSNGKLAGHHEWIEKLLVYYYDPLYQSSLQRRDVKFIFRGSKKECMEFLQARI